MDKEEGRGYFWNLIKSFGGTVGWQHLLQVRRLGVDHQRADQALVRRGADVVHREVHVGAGPSSTKTEISGPHTLGEIVQGGSATAEDFLSLIPNSGRFHAPDS